MPNPLIVELRYSPAYATWPITTGRVSTEYWLFEAPSCAGAKVTKVNSWPATGNGGRQNGPVGGWFVSTIKVVLAGCGMGLPLESRQPLGALAFNDSV